jgi:rhamnosyltransferase
MAKRPSIASVTVAYNGAQALPRHLDALRQQTQQLDEIVVVNNASTDDTLKLLARSYPESTILNLPENIGVGGGFAAGLAYAAEKNYDWIWLFDQDSIPRQDTLEMLLERMRRLGEEAETVAIFAPTCVNPETGARYPGLIWKNGLRAPDADTLSQPWSFVDTVISSGSLLRREAVERVGSPRQDFFMDFVDHEYCLRLRRDGFRIVVVGNSILDHAIGSPRRVNILGWSRPFTEHVPWREYYMTRNEVFTIWKYYPDWKTKYFFVSRWLWHALGVLMFSRRRADSLKMMYFGFLDGRAERLGVRFLESPRRTTSFSSASENEARPVIADRAVETEE